VGLEPLCVLQIDWPRGKFAAVAFLSPSRLASRPASRAGAEVRTVEAQSDAWELKRCTNGSFSDAVEVLLKRRVGDKRTAVEPVSISAESAGRIRWHLVVRIGRTRVKGWLGCARVVNDEAGVVGTHGLADSCLGDRRNAARIVTLGVVSCIAVCLILSSTMLYPRDRTGRRPWLGIDKTMFRFVMMAKWSLPHPRVELHWMRKVQPAAEAMRCSQRMRR
jgi:hypothetical protein